MGKVDALPTPKKQPPPKDPIYDTCKSEHKGSPDLFGNFWRHKSPKRPGVTCPHKLGKCLVVNKTYSYLHLNSFVHHLA